VAVQEQLVLLLQAVVLVGPNYGDEGEAFFNALGGTWVKTSYNGNIRKNYAGNGYAYDPTFDAFIPPKCHDEAVLDEGYLPLDLQ
jgi:hypothetical protein